MPVPVRIPKGISPEDPANVFLRGRDATHLYIQVQFMRSERLSRLLSLILPFLAHTSAISVRVYRLSPRSLDKWDP